METLKRFYVYEQSGDYRVRPDSDGKYEVIKSFVKKEDTFVQGSCNVTEEVVFVGRLSDCESYINLVKKGLLTND